MAKTSNEELRRFAKERIEYLNELKDKSKNKKTAEYIGEIFLKMLKASCFRLFGN